MKNERCPHCGYCPHCGRSNPAPSWPYQQYPWTNPYPITVPYPITFWNQTSDSSQSSQTGTVRFSG